MAYISSDMELGNPTHDQHRHNLLPLLAVVLLLAGDSHSRAASFESVRQRAAALAEKRYEPAPQAKLPEALEQMNYNQFHQVQFHPESLPWFKDELKFDLWLIPRGYLFRDALKINLLANSVEQKVNFSPSMFDFSAAKLVVTDETDLDFAGFKLIYHDQPGVKEREVASFLGASYFRIVGERLRYGASARCLAIDTGETVGEEFPRLIEFWLEKPEKQASQLRIIGLLDSPSVAGACQFLLSIGALTTVQVEVSLFPRVKGKKFGIAPLTSMFLAGENRTRYIADFRPEVHDSDGLLIVTQDGERLWRPLDHPEKRHRISKFPLQNPKAFGLMQRDRSFSSFEDLEARYDLRPGLWVEAEEKWGDGVVELVEIPTPNEYNDNIVAYWVPAQPLEPKREMRFGYRLTAVGEEPPASLMKVVATRIGTAAAENSPRFVVDFGGGTLESVEKRRAVKPIFASGGDQIQNAHIVYNDVTGGWRVVFDLAETEMQKDVRCFLEAAGKPLSETWMYSTPGS